MISLSRAVTMSELEIKGLTPKQRASLAERMYMLLGETTREDFLGMTDEQQAQMLYERLRSIRKKAMP